ncbi:MAG: 2-oxoacid:acceptor oxidoreductase family protein [Elusimicrobiota bacterium]|nr:2-oxoacid:acceptor oxidoreductase family protein [Elusimicrobiota bacterium]
MRDEILIAGSGGQGILLTGRVLAETALLENLFVTYYPSYGAEIRGGTANCTVIISDKEIYSPTVSKVKSMLILNAQSFVKFIYKLIPPPSDGLIIVNSSLVNVSQIATELKNKISTLVEIPATEIAQKLGNVRSANMVMLGAYTKLRDFISKNSVIEAIKNVFSDREELIDININAFKEGYK